MLINESKSDKISRGIITQAEHMKRRKHKTIYIREAGRAGRAKMGCQADKGSKATMPWAPQREEQPTTERRAAVKEHLILVASGDPVHMLVIN